ncbi:TPA: MFS transporter [Legionella pneumophila]|nr:MFS transporter [Legionella pneumophila]
MSTVEQRMPKGIMSLYLIQMFSTFSFAVLYSSLSLYITNQLGLSNHISNSIVGLFLAFNFVLHLFGGLIGGNWLSNRFLFLFTTILQTFGILCLVFPETPSLYLGLSLFLIGCGLNTTCYNTILTQRFSSSDPRRDKAFFMSYSTMNIGFWAGFICSGFYDASNHYEEIFYASIATNIITTLLVLYCWKNITDINTALALNPAQKQRIKGIGGILFILLLIPVLNICFKLPDFSNGLVITISVLMFFVILFIRNNQKILSDRQKITAFLILTITSTVFWMIYYTGPMGITLFIKNNVDKQLLGFEIPTQWILNINSVVIIIGSPLIALLISKLQNKGYTFSVSTQFIWAFLFLTISFFSLSCGIHFANEAGYTAFSWIILHLVTQAVAELFIGPVGYAMIGRIAPNHLQGLLMGSWMLVSGVSASLSHYFSNSMIQSESSDPLLSNSDYYHVFNELAVWGLAGALFLYLIAGRLRLFMNERSNKNDSASPELLHQ